MQNEQQQVDRWNEFSHVVNHGYPKEKPLMKKKKSLSATFYDAMPLAIYRTPMKKYIK